MSVSTDEQAERVVRNLHGSGYRLKATLEQTSTGRLATVRMQPAGAGPALVDLLFASTGIEAEVVAAAELLEIYPGQTVPVATVGHLLAMVLARDDDGRPQDRADLKALFTCAAQVDVEQAQACLKLIEARGCARGRDLPAAWQKALSEFSPDNDPQRPRGV